MNLLCLIIGHKFDKFRIRQHGFPYDTGFIDYSDFCFRCGEKHE